MLDKKLYIAAYHQSPFGKLKEMQVPEIVQRAVTEVCDEIDVSPEAIEEPVGEILHQLHSGDQQQGG